MSNHVIQEAKARVIGYLQGDGHVTQEYARFYTVEKEMAELFIRDLKTAYNIVPYQRFTKSGKTGRKNIIEVGTGKTNVVSDLNAIASFGEKWLPPTFETENETISYVQSLFDAEGTVSFSPKYKTRKIHLFSKNLAALQKVCRMLNSFGIRSNICGPIRGYLHQLIISGRGALVSFAEKINFRNPRKSSALAHMLASYQPTVL